MDGLTGCLCTDRPIVRDGNSIFVKGTPGPEVIQFSTLLLIDNMTDTVNGSWQQQLAQASPGPVDQWQCCDSLN